MDRIHIFDLGFPVGFEFDWHRDYRYGRQVERSFAGTLNIRDTAVVSDIKYVWEPSRFQHLSALAFAADAEKHASYIVRSIDSWITGNPYLYGVNWTSSLELAERVISWAMLYPRIADHVARDEAFRQRWLESIYLHLTRISQRLSLYSSANNHLIGELIGLFVGASCFDFWPECSGWRDRAQKLLEREIRLQIGEDGVNREQAMSYHIFTMELFLLAFALARNTVLLSAKDMRERLRGMAGFLDAVATSSRRPAMVRRFRRCARVCVSGRRKRARSQHAVGRTAFCASRSGCVSARRHGGGTSARSRSLRDLESDGQADRSARELFPMPDWLVSAAARTAYVFSWILVHRALPMAAHGHADALSLWLSIGDEYFLVDAGTYAYHSHPEWRELFSQHGGTQYSICGWRQPVKMAGRFLWGAKANARLLRFETKSEGVTIEAEHDGYMRLQDPVTHRRSVSFERSTGNLSIAETFQCTGRHEVDLFFHMHEEADVIAVGEGEAEVEWRGRKIVFSSPDGNGHCLCHWEIVRGSEDPKLGWRSSRFNQKQPTSTLRSHIQIEGPTTIRTHLRMNS